MLGLSQERMWVVLVLAMPLLMTPGCELLSNPVEGDRYFEGDPISLQFPFQDSGTYYVTQGGHHPSQNYHYWSRNFRDWGIHVSMRYAVDIHMMGEAGNDRDVRHATSLEDVTMFDVTPYSPADGVVWYLEDGHPDMPPGRRDVESPRGKS